MPGNRVSDDNLDDQLYPKDGPQVKSFPFMPAIDFSKDERFQSLT